MPSPRSTHSQATAPPVPRSGFSGTKESTLGQLEAFAADGFVAMSFDMPEHGERLIDADAQALATRVRSNLRTFFWAILAQSAADFSALIDWAVETLGVEPRVAVGGQSAGGDAAVAATGLDDRIACCVTSVSTPVSDQPRARTRARSGRQIISLWLTPRTIRAGLEASRQLGATGCTGRRLPGCVRPRVSVHSRVASALPHPAAGHCLSLRRGR